jgi:diguanylate cyclase (GGDEF)-like protein
MSLALMDIDQFKLINDRHGHAVGDVVLHRFGECAQTAVRVGDMLARWGGEEFLLVMPATAPAQAMAAMERVREALRQASFDDIAPGLVVTFSAGVSECAGERDLSDAIARADTAMYEAKRTGRNRVVAGAPAPTAASAHGVVRTTAIGLRGSAAERPQVGRTTVEDQGVRSVCGLHCQLPPFSSSP